MGIANELSSEVAAAVLARRPETTRAGTEELVEIVRDFHSTMRALVSEERRRRVAQVSSAESAPQGGGRAASGPH